MQELPPKSPHEKHEHTATQKFQFYFVVSLIAAAWVSSAVHAQQPAPVPEQQRTCRVPFISHDIQIDGRADDLAWRDVPWLEAFVFPWPARSPEQETRAKLAWNEKNLYAVFFCEDKNIQAIRTERDSPVYEDDCVELFASPFEHEPNRYFNLEMNVRGAQLDNFRPHGKKTSAVWDPDGIQIAVTVIGTLNDDRDRDQSWTLELAFPFSALAGVASPPEVGDAWRLNLNRLDRTPDLVRSMWSPIRSERASFHQPEFFGRVIFDK